MERASELTLYFSDSDLERLLAARTPDAPCAVIITGAVRGSESVKWLVVPGSNNLVYLALVRAGLFIIQVVHFHLVRISQEALALHVS